MLIEKLIEKMFNACKKAFVEHPSASQIDPGVWNDQFMPTETQEYLRDCCAYNVWELIRHITRLHAQIKEQADQMIASSVAAQGVLLDIKDILEEYKHGIIRSNTEPESDLRIQILSLLRDHAALKSQLEDGS